MQLSMYLTRANQRLSSAVIVPVMYATRGPKMYAACVERVKQEERQQARERESGNECLEMAKGSARNMKASVNEMEHPSLAGISAMGGENWYLRRDGLATVLGRAEEQLSEA